LGLLLTRKIDPMPMYDHAPKAASMASISSLCERKKLKKGLFLKKSWDY
jgi:hypothetical protein